MQAVEDDADFALVNPRDGKVWRTVRAGDLFDKIVTYAHHNGEPGALFLDAANRANPVPHLYELEATNPCGEQWLGPYENCCLGSINLAQHVTEDGQVDWAEAAREHRSWRPASSTTWWTPTSTCRRCRNCARPRCGRGASAWASWAWAT